ncbi:MAG: ABC-2 family transporter protein [Clostridia bacterium]|nr:ABC-2 family transporter protein [Clostridia bacterium]
MRKYLYIYKSEVISSLSYVLNIVIGIFSYLLLIFIFFNLWNYIYSDSSDTINGYTIGDMIWYISITEILWSVAGGRKFCRKICDDVRSGNITYNINKPYSYIGYLLSSHLGEVTIKFIIYFISAIIVGFIFVGSFPEITALSIIGTIISMILAIIINSLFIIFIGLVSFYIEDANPLYWLYSKFLLVVGTLFPIEIFPEGIQGFLKLSPIYVITYGPAKLFVDFSVEKFLNIIIAQIIYIGISFGLCKILYKKGVRKLNVNGG